MPALGGAIFIRSDTVARELLEDRRFFSMHNDSDSADDKLTTTGA